MGKKGPSLRTLMLPDAPAQRQGRSRPLITTLLVFASVIAALGAGALLIRTTQDFAERGEEATAAQGGSLEFRGAHLETTDPPVLVFTAAPGIGGTDLRGLDLLIVPEGGEPYRFAFSDAPDLYHVEVLRDNNGSITPTEPWLDRGDLVLIQILPLDQGLEIRPGTTFTLVQDRGGDVVAVDTFRAPARFTGIVPLEQS